MNRDIMHLCTYAFFAQFKHDLSTSLFYCLKIDFKHVKMKSGKHIFPLIGNG